MGRYYFTGGTSKYIQAIAYHVNRLLEAPKLLQTRVNKELTIIAFTMKTNADRILLQTVSVLPGAN